MKTKEAHDMLEDFFGDRYARLAGIWSNVWILLRHLEDGTPREVEKPSEGDADGPRLSKGQGAPKVPNEPLTFWVARERATRDRLARCTPEDRHVLARAFGPEELAPLEVRNELRPLGELALVIAHGREREEVRTLTRRLRRGDAEAKATLAAWRSEAAAQVEAALHRFCA